MNTKKIHIAGILLIVFVAVASRLFASAQREAMYYASGFGFLALLSLIFVLAIPLMVKYTRIRLSTYLMANRRWIGIYVFIFALLHVLAVYGLIYGWDIIKVIQNPNAPFLALGSLAFVILASMAATSNNFAVKALGRNWKRLHLLVYVAIALIVAHSYNVGLVFMSNNIISTIVITLAAAVVAAKLRLKLAALRKSGGQQVKTQESV